MTSNINDYILWINCILVQTIGNCVFSCGLYRIFLITYLLGYWSGFEAAKTAPWPGWRLHHCCKVLEPSDEWAGRGCYCFLMRWHSWHYWLIRNVVEKLVELKFEFFSFNTFDVSQIFCQRVVQPGPKHSYCILLKGLCWVSVSWILNNALCSMSWMFSVFFCVKLWHQYLAPYAVLSSKYI